MRIAFYAPMKAPTHPSPSGDRRVAQLLWRALEEGGHDVSLASNFRAYDRDGDSHAQQELARQGGKIATALIADWQAGRGGAAPDLWFSYHLYHKAPDWIGPPVCAALDIPYVAAEASYARKQSGGPYATGLNASLHAIARADAILSFTPEDQEALVSLVKSSACLHRMAPFLDAAPYRAAREDREHHRAALAARHGLDAARPWLLTVAMMRPGDKLASYRLLGRSLDLIADPPWQLLIVGDGEARVHVEEALQPIGSEYVIFAGKQSAEALIPYYAASDLFVWPAANEAFGMVLLEAAAAGLPVVAGDWRGVSEIVASGETGILISPWNDVNFAEAVVELTQDNKRRIAMAEAAAVRAESEHSLKAAVADLNRALDAACALHREAA